MLKLAYDQLPYQWDAVRSACNVFKGQPHHAAEAGTVKDVEGFPIESFGNAPLGLSEETLLDNLQAVQREQKMLRVAEKLWRGKGEAWAVNLDVEMETGTGKTYVYTQTAYELHKRYGWSKFIIVVPSVAIREGVKASLESTAEHFNKKYGISSQVAVYNSKRLHEVVDFTSSAGLRFLVINIQAFAKSTTKATGKGKGKSLKIDEEQDGFGSRKPIDVLRSCRPILILDEPQKMEGKATTESLPKFDPLFVLRYSATHKTVHDLVYRLDALDAYNQKLVKKIAVTGLAVKHLAGKECYLYLSEVENITKGYPRARLEMEKHTQRGIQRVQMWVERGANLYELSNRMQQYDGLTVTELRMTEDGGEVTFSNGGRLQAGDMVGRGIEEAIREVQVRETVRAHLRTEANNLRKGIKTLALFFIHKVADYRDYEREDTQGELYRLFERVYAEEVETVLDDLAWDAEHKKYLWAISAQETHLGYFSIDKKTKRCVDGGDGEKSKDEDLASEAYDLILKDKASLLSLEESARSKVRFIFSHSALREGWDNPNVFTMCLFKTTDNVITRRQEVGRGLRLCVQQDGTRWKGGNVHDVNVLNVITSESCKLFVANLQKEMTAEIAGRPIEVTSKTFEGLQLTTASGLSFTISKTQAKKLHSWLNLNSYIDDEDVLTEAYVQARRENTVAPNLPEGLEAVREPLLQKLDEMVLGRAPKIENGRDRVRLAPNKANLHKKEFQELWQRIHRKVSYEITIDTEKLIDKCVATLNSSGAYSISELQIQVGTVTQKDELTAGALHAGDGFKDGRLRTETIRSRASSAVRYDLVGELAAEPEGTDAHLGTGLTRRTIVAILKRLEPVVFNLYKINPEAFIRQTAQHINCEKARQVVEKLIYHPLDDVYDIDIFNKEGPMTFKTKCTPEAKLSKHVYDYVVTDSKTEEAFAKALDNAEEVAVFSKLPRGFKIPTPVGNYNPDWAIAFNNSGVKYIYFVAETKGSSNRDDLRANEAERIACAERYFAQLPVAQNVHYGVVTDYTELMKIVKPN